MTSSAMNGMYTNLPTRDSNALCIANGVGPKIAPVVEGAVARFLFEKVKNAVVAVNPQNGPRTSPAESVWKAVKENPRNTAGGAAVVTAVGVGIYSLFKGGEKRK